MATYAIGDIQGCWDTLRVLLDEIEFDPGHDSLLLAGDLVNRGPKSLKVLRWAHSTDGVQMVLGNHDLHLIGCHLGVRRSKSRDTFDDVLDAPDVDVLVDWLCGQPLLVEHDDWAVVHAGVNPTWSWKQIRKYANELHVALEPKNRRAFLEASYEKPAHQWSEDLEPPERWGALFHTFTRMRICKPSGKMDLAYKYNPRNAPKGFAPWFDHKSPRGKKRTILFGHWSALGFYETDTAVCLDSGCVWGGELSALRLDDRTLFQVESQE